MINIGQLKVIFPFNYINKAKPIEKSNLLLGAISIVERYGHSIYTQVRLVTFKVGVYEVSGSFIKIAKHLALLLINRAN